MKTFVTTALILAGIIVGQELTAAPTASKPASQPASKPTSMAAAATLNGTFVWTGKPGQSTAIKAVLTPTAADEWDVVYTFKWGGSAMTYFGRMKGSLANGELAGEGAPKDRARTFAFKGAVKDGVVTFSHWETTRNRITQTGNGSMKQG